MSTYGRRRAFGQHFLKDAGVVRSIVDRVLDSGLKTKASRWIEIGPGEGALTTPVLKSLPDDVALTLIEKDRSIATEWALRAQVESRLSVLSADFLDLDDSQWMSEGQMFVFSNLPYSSGTRIFTSLCGHVARIPRMVLMFQAEVARRIRADPSTADRGSLSLYAQNLFAVEKALLVKPNAFSPPPRVDSEVIELIRRDEPLIPESQTTPERDRAWQALIKKAFSHRRKMIRGVFSKDPVWGEALERCGLDGKMRAEELDFSQWRRWFVEATSKLGLLLVAFANPATAQFFDNKGYGPRSMALGGALAADGAHGLSLFHQPALVVPLNGPEGKSSLEFTVGLQYSKPSLEGQSGIVVENTTTGDSLVEGGRAEPPTKSIVGQLIGFNWLAYPKLWKLSFGATAFLPLSPVATIDTGETYLPEYFLERSRSQKPVFFVGAAVEPIEELRLGFAFQTLYQIDTGASLYLQTDPTKPSSIRFEADLKLKPAPLFGAHYRFGSDKRWSTGLVIRLPARSEASIDLASAVRVFGSAGSPFVFRLNALSGFYEQPFSAEWGWKLIEPDFGASFLEVDYQRWSAVRSPIMTVRNPATETCENPTYCPLTVSPGVDGSAPFRDIVILRAGQEWAVSERTALRLGYSFRQKVLKWLPVDGDQNLIDADRHQIGAGASFSRSEFFGHAIAWTIEAGAFVEFLQSGEVKKSSTTEIGAPGYAFGGKIWGLGVSLNWVL